MYSSFPVVHVCPRNIVLLLLLHVHLLPKTVTVIITSVQVIPCTSPSYVHVSVNWVEPYQILLSAVFPKVKQKKKSQQITIYTQSGRILSTIPVSFKGESRH